MRKLKEHEMICRECGQVMDLRDLSQVLAHENCNGIPVNYLKVNKVECSGSMKLGDPVLNTNGNGIIILN